MCASHRRSGLQWCRETQWAAPVVWSWIFSSALFIIGLLGVLGFKYELGNTPMQWLNEWPCPIFVTLMGFFGLVITPLTMHKLHVIFSFLNLGFWANLAYSFLFTFRIGTVIYPVICMGGAMWFLIRTVHDLRIRLIVWNDAHTTT